MLGIVLVIVGFVLFHNAWFGLFGKVKDENAGKTLAVVNLLGGASIFIISLFTIHQGDAYFSAMIYMIVGLTYLYIGLDHRYSLDPKPFGVFCLTGAIALFIGGVLTIRGGLDTWREIWLLICWFSWSFLWFILFLQYALEKKKLGKLTAYTCLLTTFYTGLIPGFMMLAGWW